MVVIKYLTASILVFLVFVVNVNAIPTITITVNPLFHTGDSIKFSYTILPSKSEHVTYIPSVNCVNAPQPLLYPKEIDFIANQPFSDSYTFMTVDQNVLTGNCIAYVSITSPYHLSVNKTFFVESLSILSIEIKSCKDVSCYQKTNVFVKGSDIYLNYDTNVSNPSIKATLTYPDKTTQQMTIPTSFKAEQIGTYNLKITTSKSGYWNKTVTYQFGVIEQEANFPLTGLCSKDGICAPGCFPEDPDCASPLSYWPYILVVIIFVVIVFLAIKIRKRKANSVVLPPQI